MKTCVIIPTYNEAGTIGDIVRKVTRQGLSVLVIDDGSLDETRAVARAQGAVVLSNDRNLGKGCSLIRGFAYALDNHFDAAITMDGDGQHDPEDIAHFIRAAGVSTSGLFIGNRMLQRAGMPRIRAWTNKYMSWMISRLARQDIPDTQCGFRLIRKEVLQGVNLICDKYEIESEIIVKAARLGVRIESVPVKTIYNSAKSRINPVVDTLRFIRFIARELWTTPS
jgi:glycosyltransferase involved in cell wall biosynthesis